MKEFNSDKKKHEDLRESWIESLLWSATQTEDHADRISRAMSRIVAEGSEPQEQEQTAVHAKRRVQSRSRFRYRWPSIGIAAAVLLSLFFLFPNGGSRTAMAAIQRSLDVAAERLTRKYLVRIQYRPTIGRSVEVNADLYVQGADRFALRHPGVVPRTNLWLGRDGKQSWILPVFGPVIKGDSSIFERRLVSYNDLDAPNMHIRNILTRMSRGYHLQALRDEEITTPDGPVTCQHIRAELKPGKRMTPGARPTALSSPPEEIELWASRESGMAMRLVAHWNLDSDAIGRESIELTYQSEEPTLTDEWFTAEGHMNGTRRVIDVSNRN